MKCGRSRLIIVQWGAIFELELIDSVSGPTQGMIG